MSDPFAPNSNAQLVREARIGLSVVAAVLVVFVSVVYVKITGTGRKLPDHVRLAPVAQPVWPNSWPETDTGNVSGRSLAAGPSESFSNRAAGAGPPKASRPEHQLRASLPSFSSREDGSDDNAVAAQTQQTIAAVSRTLDEIRSTARELKNDLTIAPVGFEQVVDIPSKAKTSTSDSKKHANAVCLEPRPAFSPVRPVLQQSPLRKPPEKEQVLLDSTNVTPPPKRSSSLASPSHAERREGRERASSEFSGRVDHAIEVPSLNRTAPEKRLFDSEDNSFIPANSDDKLTPREPAKDNKPLVLPNRLRPDEDNALPKPSPQPSPKGRGSQNGRGRQYQAQVGDSFWSIAQQHYGDGRYFRALFHYNEAALVDFDTLPAGTLIELPSAEELADRWPQLCPVDDRETTSAVEPVNRDAADEVAGDYVTRAGETLFSIAAQQLGQASRYLEIKSLNESRLAESLPAGSAAGDQPLPAGLKLVLPQP